MEFASSHVYLNAGPAPSPAAASASASSLENDDEMQLEAMLEQVEAEGASSIVQAPYGEESVERRRQQEPEPSPVSPSKPKSAFSSFMARIGLGGSKNKKESQSSSSQAPPPPASFCQPPPQYRKKKKPTTFKKPIDTNVLAVKFSTLAQKSESLFAGDAQLCKCGAALNHMSVILDHEGKQLKGKADASSSSSSSSSSNVSQPGQGTTPQLPSHIQLDSDSFLWVCEFCGHENILEGLQAEEIPTSISRDYVLEPAPVKEKKSTDGDGLLLFVLDISGSMCVTSPVPGNIQLKLPPKAVDPSLLAFADIDMAANRASERVTYISRLQSVQASIAAQLEEFSKEAPNRRVGLITFNNEVTIVGDGTSTPIVVTGDKLNDSAALESIGRSYVESGGVQQPVSSSHAKLTQSLFALEETGPTALGPALTLALAIARNERGAQIIVCTDGLANVGLGRMDTNQSAEEIEAWYQSQGEMAKQNGITVSVISIKGDECRLELLGLVAAASGGQVERVDPSTIDKEFGAIMRNPIIATNVKCTFYLHAGLQFIKDVELDEQANPDASANGADGKSADTPNRLSRDIGNVWADSETTIAYALRPNLGDRYSHLSTLPFQAHIEFTTLDGMRALRVMSQSQRVTHDRAVAESDVKVELVSAQIAQRSAQLAKAGLYRESRINWVSAQSMMNRIAQSPQQQEIMRNYVSNIEQFDRVASEQERLHSIEDEVDDCVEGDMLNAPASGSALPPPAPGAPMPSAYASSSSSLPPRAFKSKKAAPTRSMNDETYMILHRTTQLNSSALQKKY